MPAESELCAESTKSEESVTEANANGETEGKTLQIIVGEVKERTAGVKREASTSSDEATVK